MARASGAEHDDVLARVQNDLFDLGADLCVPQADGEEERLRVQPQQVLFLEQQIDQLTRDLAPLRSFILPGGRLPAAWLHLARTVCRRAERATWQLAEQEPVSQPVLQYLNRLSDLLFAMAYGPPTTVGSRMCCGSRGRARTMRKWILVGPIHVGGGV